jgi:hypothetical protein
MSSFQNSGFHRIASAQFNGFRWSDWWSYNLTESPLKSW